MSLKRLFKKAKKFIAPALGIAGAAFGGPLGGWVGSKLGGLLGKKGGAVGSQIGQSIGRGISGVASSAKSLLSPELVAGIAGDIYSGKQMQAASKDQMAFQERMASTQHQREVADLKAAGLNPMLSGTGGAGAAAPSGSSYDVPDYGERLSSALQLKLQKTQIDNINAQTANTNAQTAQTVQATAKEAAGKPYWEKSASLDLEKKLQEIDSLETGERLTAAEAHKAQLLLKDMLKNPQLRQYMLSAPYAERMAFNKILSGDADASALATGVKLLKELIR